MAVLTLFKGVQPERDDQQGGTSDENEIKPTIAGKRDGWQEKILKNSSLVDF